MSNVIKFRILLWLGLLGVTGWFLYMAIVPSGQITYIHNFDEANFFIHKLSPQDRLGEQINGAQQIIGDPVYFTLRTPRTFDTARLTYKYKNNAELPLIETGVLVDKTIWRYDLQPLENRMIDQLSLVWDKIEENCTVLLQRQRRFQSIAEFTESLPAREEIALYNFDLKSEYLIPDYSTSTNATNINKVIRGSYEFYTYIGEEDLDFIFTISDINANSDPDPVDIHLYYNDQLIDVRHLDDDGIVEDSGETKEVRKLEFKLANLPPGAYKLELKANNDIITKEIISQQDKLAFINKLWLHDTGEENFSIYTDGTELHAQTVNPDSLQTLSVNEEFIRIDETYKQFSSRISGTSSEIKIEKDDIIISGNGVFSFSRESLVNPRFKRVEPSLDINNSGINYIIANYNSAEEKTSEWHEASANFEIKEAYRENYGYSFIISIPGLRADDELEDHIELGEIRVDLEGRTLSEKLREKLSK